MGTGDTEPMRKLSFYTRVFSYAENKMIKISVIINFPNHGSKRQKYPFLLGTKVSKV